MTVSTGDQDRQGRLVARAGGYRATQPEGRDYCLICRINETTKMWRQVGVAHNAAAARRMVRDMAAGK